MKKPIISSGLLIVLLFGTVFNALSQSEEELKAKIEKMNAKMVKALIKGDHQAGLAYYLDDAISMPSYHPMLKGIEAIKESAKESENSGMKVTSFEMHTKKVESNGDLVIEIGKYNIGMQWEGMPEPIEDKGKYLTIWQIQSDGSLKIKVDTWNTDMNPWEKKPDEKKAEM